MSLSNGVRKINVEIEKVVQNAFDYSEVYLRFNGEKSRYKMIVRKDVLMAIVKRGYKLIPHELVDRVLADIGEIAVKEKHEEGGRCYWRCAVSGRDDVEILVENSIDSSLALATRLVLLFGSSRFVMTKEIKAKVGMDMKRIHKKSADVNELPQAIRGMLQNVDKVKQWVEKVFALRAIDFKDVWELVKEEIPEKYTREIFARLYAIPNNSMTVGDVYKDIARHIWSNPKSDMNTKMMFIQRLNEALWIIGEAVEFG